MKNNNMLCIDDTFQSLHVHIFSKFFHVCRYRCQVESNFRKLRIKW